MRTLNGGQIDGRKAIDAQLEIAGRADHDQRQNDHRGEDRPANTDFSELLHADSSLRNGDRGARLKVARIQHHLLAQVHA